MSKDEDAAAKEWKEYHRQTHEGKSDTQINDNYDGFFAGFYAGRDYEKSKGVNSRAANAAHKVLHGKGQSKAEKTKRGSALTQR